MPGAGEVPRSLPGPRLASLRCLPTTPTPVDQAPSVHYPDPCSSLSFYPCSLLSPDFNKKAVEERGRAGGQREVDGEAGVQLTVPEGGRRPPAHKSDTLAWFPQAGIHPPASERSPGRGFLMTRDGDGFHGKENPLSSPLPLVGPPVHLLTHRAPLLSSQSYVF